jgi:hypothetical protein
MAKSKNQTAGNTQDIGDEKPKKPKPIAQITLTVRDDGSIAGDFWVWEVDELDRRKKWTVSGDDFFKFMYRVQPKNVRVLASCCNVQIVTANLPEECQGPWITMKGGKARVLTGDEIKVLMAAKSPVGSGQGEKLADSATAAAEKAAGLTSSVTPV